MHAAAMWVAAGSTGQSVGIYCRTRAEGEELAARAVALGAVADNIVLIPANERPKGISSDLLEIDGWLW